MPSRNDDPADVMDALEASMPVALVTTFGLESVDAESPLADALVRLEALNLDVVPVRTGDIIVGVLERRVPVAGSAKTVRDATRPLDDRMLVAATDPLLDLIEALADPPHYRLVLRNRRIDGIVTLSDLQRLAVRSLLFSRVAHVELLLARWLRERCGTREEIWLGALSDGRRSKLEKQLAELRLANMEVDLLTASQFCDKRDAAVKLGAFSDAKEARSRLKNVEDLRNQIAHANDDYASSEERALQTIRTAQEARVLIQQLRSVLEKMGQASADL